MKNNELQFGGLMLLGFISFFFIMKALGLYTSLELRALNIIIHGTFAFLAMRAFRKSNKGSAFSYLDTFAVGFRTSLLPVLGFAVFQFVYLSFLNPSFMVYVNENAIFGELLTPLYASLFLVMEGLGVSIFTSYIGMRYLTVVEKVPSVSEQG